MAGTRLLGPLLLAALLALLGGCGSGNGGTTAAGASGHPQARAASGGKGGSASFIVPGGDNSVQEFGREASPGEREAASRILQGYLRARAARDFGAQCAALAQSAVEPLEELSAPRGSSGRGKAACEAALQRLAGSRPGPADTMTGPIGALRVRGARGFALYHGAGGIDYVVPMRREGVLWKVATLEPVELG
ncbi:MAG TPA: hypothetical protein VF731_14535 [Solirubrobacterales bacterium]